MTDVGVGPLSAEEARIRDAADQAYQVLRGVAPGPMGVGGSTFDLIRDATRRAPLRALGVVGLIVARRR